VSQHYFYVVGGISDANPTASDSVFFALQTPDGVAEWQETTPLPTPVYGNEVFIGLNGTTYSNLIFSIGGFHDGEVQPSVFYAELGDDGHVGEWKNASDLPAPRIGHAIAATNTRVYVSGGLGPDAMDGPQADVWVGTHCLVD
jgi:hypothetical protein